MWLVYDTLIDCTGFDTADAGSTSKHDAINGFLSSDGLKSFLFLLECLLRDFMLMLKVVVW